MHATWHLSSCSKQEGKLCYICIPHSHCFSGLYYRWRLTFLAGRVFRGHLGLVKATLCSWFTSLSNFALGSEWSNWTSHNGKQTSYILEKSLKKKTSCQSSSASCDSDMKSHHFCILKVLQAHNSTLSAQYVQNRKMSHSITLQDVTIVLFPSVQLSTNQHYSPCIWHFSKYFKILVFYKCRPVLLI